MVALTQGQIDELSSIANSGQSGARVAYYTKLAEFGVSYGSLALGVVLEDQISGRVANAYFMAVAEQENVSVSPQQWASIGNGLMLADFAARLAGGITASDGTASYPDLAYATIRDYHATVFDNLGGTVPDGDGVSINGWTAYAPVETYGTGKWDEMLTASQFGQAESGAWTLFQMAWEARNGDSPLAIQWASMIALPAFETALASGSPAAFADSIDDAHIVLGTLGDDTLSIPAGTPIDDRVVVMGLGGDDTISIQGHGDLFDGGSGNDTFLFAAMDGELIHGGSGQDTANFSALSQSLQVDAEAGESSVFSGYEWGSLVSVENIIGTIYDDSFTISDSIAAQDIQIIDAGDGIDSIYLGQAAEQLHIDLETGSIIGVGTITALGFENAVGGEANDTILGTSTANQLQGGIGDDHIEGRAGDDMIWGQDGNDTLLGGDGDDLILAGGGDDIVRGDNGDDSIHGEAGNDAIEGGAGNDSLGGADGDDHIWGDEGKDSLYGDAGDDFLYGGDGDDDITGGDGYNIVTGGAGRDYFYVRGANDTTLIMDFELGIDRFGQSSERISFADSSDGLRLIYDDGATAILAGISTSTPDWDLYV